MKLRCVRCDCLLFKDTQWIDPYPRHVQKYICWASPTAACIHMLQRGCMCAMQHSRIWSLHKSISVYWKTNWMQSILLWSQHALTINQGTVLMMPPSIIVIMSIAPPPMTAYSRKSTSTQMSKYSLTKCKSSSNACMHNSFRSFDCAHGLVSQTRSGMRRSETLCCTGQEPPYEDTNTIHISAGSWQSELPS